MIPYPVKATPIKRNLTWDFALTLHYKPTLRLCLTFVTSNIIDMKILKRLLYLVLMPTLLLRMALAAVFGIPYWLLTGNNILNSYIFVVWVDFVFGLVEDHKPN